MIDTSKRQQALTKLVREKKQALKKAPPGRLRVSSTQGYVRLYHVSEVGDNTGKYLTQDQKALAQKLAQKAYDEQVLAMGEQELRAWKQLAALFPDKTVEEVFDNLSPIRQKLVKPIRLTDEEYRQQWEAVTYEPGSFQPGEAVYITDRGERVRSKSEQLIANLLYRLGIPYRYEYPIQLMVDGRSKTFRPDFMILDVKHRREFFLEHLGMLGDPEYARRNFEKIRIYEENGLYEGHGMYYTFEAQDAPADMRYVEAKVTRILRDGR